MNILTTITARDVAKAIITNMITILPVKKITEAAVAVATEFSERLI